MGSYHKIFRKYPDLNNGYKPKRYASGDRESCTNTKILLLGMEGCGKSSIVNSVYTAVSGVYQERAKCGGGSPGHGSKFFKRYDVSQCEDKLSTKTFKKHQLPVLFDMPGLPPHDTMPERCRAVLKAILKGRLPLHTNVYDLLSNEEAVIPECNDGDPIDRVVFVAAADKALPTEICKSVITVCEEVMGGELTVFGILTKWDRLKSKKEKSEKRKTFSEMLHAGGNPYKVLAISNYCGDVCKTPTKWQNRKGIDDPLLAFLAEICRPEYYQYDPKCVHNTSTQETVSKVVS